MALWENTAEGGTAGTTVTTANSGGGSGSAFTNVTIGAGNSVTFSDERSMRGGLSYRFAVPAAAQTNFRMDVTPDATSGIVRTRFYVYLESYPTVTQQWVQFVATGGSTTVPHYLYLGTAGQVQPVNAAGTLLASIGTLALNTWYRVEAICARGTTASNGVFRTRIYAGHSTTAVVTHDNTAADTGTGWSGTVINLHKLNASGTWAGPVYYDDLAADEPPNSSTFLGPSPDARSGSGTARSLPFVRANGTGRKTRSGSGTGRSLSLSRLTAIGRKARSSLGTARTLLLGRGVPTGRKNAARAGTGRLLGIAFGIATGTPVIPLPGDGSGVRSGAGAARELAFDLLSGGRGAHREYRFSPPTQDVHVTLLPGTRLVGRVTHGLSVWRIDGVWRTGFSPLPEVTAGADRLYGGGRIHPLSDAELADLVAGGFGDHITLMEVT